MNSRSDREISLLISDGLRHGERVKDDREEIDAE